MDFQAVKTRWVDTPSERFKAMDLRILTLAYFVLLIANYLWCLHPVFAGEETFPIGSNWYWRFFPMAALAGLVALLLPRKFEKPSDLFVTFYALNPVLPVLVYYTMVGAHLPFVLAVVATHAAFFLLTRQGVAYRQEKPSRLPFYARTHLWVLLITLIMIGLFITTLGWQGFAFDVMNIYEQRLALREKVADAHIIIRYGIVWTAAIMVPFLTVVFFKNRNWLLFAFTLFLSLIMFSLFFQKTFLFISLFTLVLYVCVKRFGLNGLVMVYGGMTVAGMAAYFIFSEPIVMILFSRRILYETAKISFHYYEFFSQTEFIHLSSSILRRFLDYPFVLQPPKLIGMIFFGNDQTNANTGVIGSGYMHFGYLGMALFTGLLVVISKCVDWLPLSRNELALVGTLFMVPVGNIMISSDFFSGLLTGGWCVMFAIFFMRENIAIRAHLLPKHR